MLRTWAVYNRHFRLGVALIAWSAMIWVSMLACLWIFTLSIQCKHCRVVRAHIYLIMMRPAAPLYSHHIAGTTCNATRGNPMIFVYWILFIVYELGRAFIVILISVSVLTMILSMCRPYGWQSYSDMLAILPLNFWAYLTAVTKDRYTKSSAMFNAIFRDGNGPNLLFSIRIY